MGLVARLPAGMIYRGHRARLLMVAALAVMALCNIGYTFAVQPLTFALVHALNGLAFAAATTVYLAFFVESLPAGTERSHAMGYYSGCLAVGFSSGSFLSGYVSDLWGYAASFQVAAAMALLASVIVLAFIGKPPPEVSAAFAPSRDRVGPLQAVRSLGGLMRSRMATTMLVALFVNMLHQLGTAFFPLYGLSVGLNMTQVGVIRGLYALCNAITRPISGLVVKRIGTRRLSYAGIPLESFVMMSVPLFAGVGALGVIFVVAGLLRAVVTVANATSLVESADASRMSRGMSSGVYHAAGDMGNILGPALGGMIAAVTGIAHLFFVAPPFLTAAFLLTLLSRKFFGVAPRRAEPR
jgi:predicted MFS family arabinose efflux permease